MSIRYANTTKIGDEFRSEIVAAIEPEPLSDLEYMALLQRLDQERADKALRMYNLWRERRLPVDVVVIETTIERTGYGDYRIPDYGAPKVEIPMTPPVPEIHTVSVQLHRHADGAGGWLYLGWNEYPPRLVVGTEARREE